MNGLEKLDHDERLLIVKALAIAAVIAREHNDHDACRGMFNLLGKLRGSPERLFTIPASSNGRSPWEMNK